MVIYLFLGGLNLTKVWNSRTCLLYQELLFPFRLWTLSTFGDSNGEDLHHAGQGRVKWEGGQGYAPGLFWELHANLFCRVPFPLTISQPGKQLSPLSILGFFLQGHLIILLFGDNFGSWERGHFPLSFYFSLRYRHSFYNGEKKPFGLKTKPQPSKILLFGVTIARVLDTHSFILLWGTYLFHYIWGYNDKQIATVPAPMLFRVCGGDDSNHRGSQNWNIQTGKWCHWRVGMEIQSRRKVT